jgi:hypothetical protein
MFTSIRFFGVIAAVVFSALISASSAQACKDEKDYKICLADCLATYKYVLAHTDPNAHQKQEDLIRYHKCDATCNRLLCKGAP